MNQSFDHAYYESAYRPNSFFNREAQEATLKLIATQGDLIQLYRESKKELDETIGLLKSLVEVQELQISDLKLKLQNLKQKQ
jgi:hypothetical protein